ncbi:MAG: DNA polymerase III subunit delta [Candidatus Portnoybacteria bacterium]|nr:DNA polymerase III subunit delta [Candidatus Portnoybacteria bacterium]
MLIFLYGSDSFRSRQKLNRIIEKYETKHQSGLNFLRVDLNERGLDDIKEIIKTKPMFAEKKLIVTENLFGLKPDSQEKIVEYLKKLNLRESQEVMVVVYEKRAPDKKSRLFKFLTAKDVLSQEFGSLEGNQLENWIKKEVEARGGNIDRRAVQELAFCLGGDLWQASNEIDKLIAFKKSGEMGGKIGGEDIASLIKTKISANVFQTIDALAQRNKKNALRLLYQHFEEGENAIYLLTMFAYQFRNLLVIKELVEKGISYPELAQRTKLHPFVIKKSFQQIKNFSLDGLKKIYGHLVEMDMAVKTGRIEPRAALEMLVMEI